jgi:hypothetical protein
MEGFGALALAFAFTATFSAEPTAGTVTGRRDAEARMSNRGSIFMGVRELRAGLWAESRADG